MEINCERWQKVRSGRQSPDVRVLSQVAWGLLLLVVIHSVRGEYRYKIRGPPHPPPKPLPPRPPLPHFGSKPFPQPQFYNMKNKWPFPPAASSGHRVIPPMRGSHFQYQHPVVPQLHQQYLWNGPPQSHPIGIPHSLQGSRPQFQFKGPSLLLGANSLPSWKGEGNLNHGFRAPVLKEQFLPSPPSEYQPPKVSLPQPPAITHIGNAIDDDKGPIHTIPAPNLSPSSNPNHNHQLLHQHEASFPTPELPVFPQTHVQVHQSHGYEVREPSNDQAGHSPGGVPTYFAPDPDPSLPAPKIPATTDPYSLPSNGKTPSDLIQQQPIQVQILDSSGGLANSLSSQELFQLLHSPQHHHPQQPLVDSYGLPLVQQHYHQQGGHFPPSTFLKQGVTPEQVPDNSLVLKPEFNHPNYQTFNYEEQYQGPSHQRENYREEEYQEQDGSENIPSVTVVRKSPEATVTSFQEEFQNQKDYEQKSNIVTEEESYYDNTATNPEPDNNQDEYDEPNNDVNHKEAGSSTSYYSQAEGGNGALATSYYTTLPNREAAETLATLAAAGNVNSNLVHHIRNGEKDGTAPTRGDASVEDDYVEDEEESEDQSPQISEPVQRPKETQVQETTHLNTEHRHSRPVIPSPPAQEEKTQEYPEYADYGADPDQQGSNHEGAANTGLEKKQQHKEDTKPTNTNLQFGARIRPKRNK